MPCADLETRMLSCLKCWVVDLPHLLLMLPTRHATDRQSDKLCNNLGLTIMLDKHCACQPRGCVDGPAGIWDDERVFLLRGLLAENAVGV